MAYGISTGWVVGSLVIAVIATIAILIFITPDSRREKLNGFGKFLHDTFNFKYLVLEKILKAIYILFTCYIVVYGFLMLFQTVDTWDGTKWLGGYGLITMILGPIALRIVYEFLMMVIILVKSVVEINRKTKDPDSDSSNASKPEAAPSVSKFCAYCGAPTDAYGKCANCGKNN